MHAWVIELRLNPNQWVLSTTYTERFRTRAAARRQVQKSKVEQHLMYRAKKYVREEK